ncbi:AAA family ATPase [Deinococcus cellulosilyticus]|uniref:HDIG domain-containing protein n=1 Tax=Deinococcus cellulosilyticus (strain DSM 18568 / NBRC 106333 / KACC 11606 / 5516J-15) TaxID=1223518 RepID=A0A511MXY1_DEIC1|nr:AAA family ATPase [Deinococcus cellulosilyticus]GEM45423.1 HDIG domain-containing protein [Deinococcus cellulosilyticus NBRC 106333 = KACC 11606]
MNTPLNSIYAKQVQRCVEQLRSGKEVQFPEWKEALSPFLDWLHQLDVTPQDRLWHKEGSVDIHTSMVLQQMYRILEHEAFTPHEQLVLVLAAVLHDIGKAKATRVRDGRIVSPGHAMMGRDHIALRLRSAGFSGELVRTVMGLVGHHHDPKHLITQGAPERAFRRLARITDVRLLYWLEQADLRGRIADDLEEQLEWLDLFKLQCEEYNLWEHDPYQDWLKPLRDFEPYIQQSAVLDYEEGHIYSPEEAIARSFQWRNRPSELLILCGLSGSGKSTWAHEHFPDTEIISMDDLREDLSGDRGDQSINGQVWQQAREQLKKALREGRQVIWDATNIRRLSRERLINIGLDYHAWVKLVVFHTAPEVALRQNSLREHAVPAGVIASQIEGFQFPEVYEGHEVVFVE